MARVAVAALLAGLLFGAGLVISGMAFPDKVLAFLTLTRDWDPSLMFVMGGALAVALPGYALLQRRGHPVLTENFAHPPKWPLDRALLLGAAIFGLGWGLAGYCPGPALVSTALGVGKAALFVAAMLAGALLSSRLNAGR